MAIKALKCPNCGGIIEQFDETMKKGFCPYCDSIILDVQEKQVEFIQFMNKFQVEGISTVDNLLARARKFLDDNELSKAEEYANKVLDLDINNQEASKIIELAQVVNINGVNISVSELKDILRNISKSRNNVIRDLRLITGISLIEAKFFIESAEHYQNLKRSDVENIINKIRQKSKNYFVIKDN